MEPRERRGSMPRSISRVQARFHTVLDRWLLGGILLRSTIAAPWSGVARKNPGMAFEIARAGRFDWGVIAG